MVTFLQNQLTKKNIGLVHGDFREIYAEDISRENISHVFLFYQQSFMPKGWKQLPKLRIETAFLWISRERDVTRTSSFPRIAFSVPSAQSFSALEFLFSHGFSFLNVNTLSIEGLWASFRMTYEKWTYGSYPTLRYVKLISSFDIIFME